MQFSKAFPVALLIGSVAGAGLTANGGKSPVTPGESHGFIREAAAASPVRWDIPMARNASVEHYVGVLTGAQADEMARYLKRSGRYEGMIRAKLRARGMPEDLVYLTMVESGFNPTARSRVNAVGLWQFMAPTARGYGLRVDGYVDERRDPEKSTDAALRYLRDLHKQFGSWYLAAAAYNGGDGRVSRVMKSELGRVKGRDEGDFWKIRHRLPKETRNYVPLILASALIGKEPGKYGLGNVERWLPLETDTVAVPAGTDLELVARSIGVEEKDLTRLNPHLLKRMTPPGKDAYPVRIPEGRSDRYAADFGRIYGAEKEKMEAARAAERVAEASAARERAATAAKARTASASRARATAASRARATGARARTHTVRSGESLWTIARRNDTSVKSIQRANGLGSRSRLRPGQKLRIPR
jgi:membrane-bound lytic murein transglycosylase D